MSIANTSKGEECISIDNKVLELNRDIKTVKMQMKMPNSIGKNLGFIYAVDEYNNILGKVRVAAETHDKMLVIDTSYLPSKVNLGEKTKLTIDVTNNGKDVQDIIMIVGLFEKNTNKLIKLEQNTNIISPKSHEKLDVNLDLCMLKEGDYILKCFMWDNLNSMCPLSKMKEINVRCQARGK